MQAPAPMGIGLGLDSAVLKAASDIRDDEVNEEEDKMRANWAKRFRQERDGLIEYLEGL